MDLDRREPGAVAVCIHCGQPYIISTEAELRIMTGVEIDQMKREAPAQYEILKNVVDLIGKKIQLN